MVLEGSDHAMLSLFMEEPIGKKKKTIIYDQRWGKTNECKGIVKDSWHGWIRSHAFQFYEKLKLAREGMKKWQRVNIRNSRKIIDKLKLELWQGYEMGRFAVQEFRGTEKELKAAIKEEGNILKG